MTTIQYIATTIHTVACADLDTAIADATTYTEASIHLQNKWNREIAKRQKGCGE